MASTPSKPTQTLEHSALSAPLRVMRIRWDGLRVGHNGMKTLNSPRFGLTRNGGLRPHQGVDLESPIGTPIYAVAEGIIEDVRKADPNYGVDLLLKFRPQQNWVQYLASTGNADEDGILYAHYAHLSLVLVSKGQRVRRGMILGKTGCSGNADQRYPHLHFEIRKVRWPGAGPGGLLKRIDPELLFRVDFIKPIETLERLLTTA